MRVLTLKKYPVEFDSDIFYNFTNAFYLVQNNVFQAICKVYIFFQCQMSFSCYVIITDGFEAFN